MALGLLRRPPFDIDPERLTDLGILLKLAPTVAGPQEQRAILFEAYRFGPVARQIAQKRRAVTRQLRQIWIGYTLAHHRSIAAGRMKSWDILLLQKQDIADAASRQMVSGGGTGKTGADDHVIVSVHDLPATLLFLYELITNSKGFNQAGGQHGGALQRNLNLGFETAPNCDIFENK